MTFRIGLVGSGNISRTHARAVAESKDAELVALWGRNSAATEQLAREHGGRAYDSLDAMLDDARLDAVMIGTPSGVHGDSAITAALRGVHVLVEKPLEISTARVDAVLDACARGGATVGVVFQDRTAPQLVWLRNAIAAGVLGTPVLISASVRWCRPPEYYAGSAWRGTRALDGGGSLMNQGIHTADLLLWLLGPVARVSAVATTALHRIEVEDTVVATLEFSSGALGVLEVTTAAYPGFPRRMELSGSRGTISVEGDRVAGISLRGSLPGGLPDNEGNTSASATSPVVSDLRGHRRVIEDFVAAVRTGHRPCCDGVEGRRSVALVEAIYKSAATGTRVTL